MNKQEKSISIIVPIYKVEKYLDKCIDSLVNQTYKNLEIILVDDGSPDNCPKICDDWAKKDNRIKVIHKQNGGLSEARNFGIEISTGDYIMFVDSDDYLDLEICKTLLDINLKYNSDFAMCGTNIVYEDKEVKLNIPENINIQVFENEEVIRHLFNSNIKFIVTAWAKLYKRQLFETIRYDVGKIHEDEFIFHKILDKTKKFVYINKPLYYYLQRQGSITKINAEKRFSNIHEAFMLRLEYASSKSEDLKQQAINRASTYFRYHYLQAKMLKQDKKTLNFILSEFKKYYKLATKKSFKLKLFNFAPKLYAFAYITLKKILK